VDARVNITMSMPSRHPLDNDGYDPHRHEYRPGYVNPRSWPLLVTAVPRIPGERLDDGERSAYRAEWILTRIDGDERREVLHVRDSALRRTLALPEQGAYVVEVRVGLQGRVAASTTRAFRFRDYLVVAIGDSFCAGQGNPDRAALASADDQVTCRTTTLRMFATNISSKVNGFLGRLESESESAAREASWLPGVVGLAVTVQDTFEKQKNAIKATIKNRVKDAASTFISGVREGIEEVAGWFGIGDGGESVEVPHGPAWQEPFAYRSYLAAHSIAARAVESDAAGEFTRVTFLNFGRSGAEIEKGLFRPRGDSVDGWARDRGQITEAADTVAGRPIDVLIVTIGINDLDFSSLATDSVLWPALGDFAGRLDRATRKVDVELPENYRRLRNVIEARLRPRRVLITEYPVGIFDELASGATRECGVLTSASGLNLNFGEAGQLGELGIKMNGAISAAATELGWTKVGGIESGFRRHGYCAEDSFFVSAQESCLNQGDFEGMLHPNGKGNRVAADCIARELAEALREPEPSWLVEALHVMMND